MSQQKKGKRTKKQQQSDFLEELMKCANVSAAAKKSKVERRQVYRWKNDDPKFVKAFDEAVAIGVEALEDEAIRRSYEGVLKPVYQKGIKVGTVREYSDTLLIFLLKGKKPEVYKDRQELTGKNGGPIQTETKIDLSNLTDEQLKLLKSLKNSLKPKE